MFIVLVFLQNSTLELSSEEIGTQNRIISAISFLEPAPPVSETEIQVPKSRLLLFVEEIQIRCFRMSGRFWGAWAV